MSAVRHPIPKRERRSVIQEILDFGPDQSEVAPHVAEDVAERIQRIVEKLQDINRRIDHLASRLD